MSIMAFLKQFANDDACRQHLERVRWPHCAVAAKCGNIGPKLACGRKHATFLFGDVSLRSVLFTDELPAYRWTGREFRAHLRVNHSAGEYVRTDPHATAEAHSNTAESWNATLKRAIAGALDFGQTP
jgi:ISXO2-like transposase domain